MAFDSADIEGIVSDIEKLKERFKQLIELSTNEFGDLKNFFDRLKEKREHKEKFDWIFGYFSDETKRDSFYKYYKELSDIFNILSPDEFLRPYLEKMDLASRIYKIVREAYDSRKNLDRELTDKVAKLIQKNVNQSGIKDALDIYEINENTLKRIEAENISDREKVFNLAKSVQALRQTESISPVLISISEKVELLMVDYKERQKTTEETLQELGAIIEEINKARREQAESGFDSETFAIYWTLRKEGCPDANKTAAELKSILDEYPRWKKSDRQEKEVKRKFIKILLPIFNEATKSLDITGKILNYLK